MDEGILLKIAVCSSIVGLTILFFISEFTNLSESNLDEISLENLDAHVKIIGTVTGVRDSGSVKILDIAQYNELKAVLFDGDGVSLNDGDYIEVIGQVSEYEGKPEIIINRMRFID